MPSIITQFILINDSLVINHDCKLSGKDHIKCCCFFRPAYQEQEAGYI